MVTQTQNWGFPFKTPCSVDCQFTIQLAPLRVTGMGRGCGGLAVERNVQVRGGRRASHCLFAQATGASAVCAQQPEGVSATWVSWDTCHGCGQPVPVPVTNWTQLSNSRQNPGDTVKKATDLKGGPKWGCTLVWKCADKCYTLLSQITPQTLKTFCTHTPTNQHCRWGFGLYQYLYV